jgi:hypothetical protein
MMHRSNMSRGNSSFQEWMEEQREAAARGDEPESDAELSIFKQLTNIQENFTNQLQELSGSLPDGQISH